MVIQALITSRLDYANVLYLGLPEYLLNRLQVVQNAAARAVLRLGPRDRISHHLKNLHWLPVRSRICFKALVLAFKALHGMGAKYIRRRVVPYVPDRSLRSARNILWLPQSILERAVWAVPFKCMSLDCGRNCPSYWDKPQIYWPLESNWKPGCSNKQHNWAPFTVLGLCPPASCCFLS